MPNSKSFSSRLVFLLLVFFCKGAHSQWVLAEVMADPSAVFDSHGEFIELAHLGTDSIRSDSLSIRIDGMVLKLKAKKNAPGSMFLVCRDSVPAENGGLECQSQCPSLNLANGRPLSVEIIQAGKGQVFQVPASNPGISWENTFDPASGYSTFLPSALIFNGKDSATPGRRNSRSIQIAQVDLGITKIAINAEGILGVEIENYGAGGIPNASLFLELDRDWDGEFETFLDSLKISGQLAQLTFNLPSAARGLLRAHLSTDENPSNNSQQIPVEPKSPLVLNEWCPAPELGRPEWIEIRNGSADAAAQGRVISLASLTLNGISLGKAAGDLAPGEYLVLTESASQFRSQFGSLKVHLLELPHWPGLRNSGDTLMLALSGFQLDSTVYSGQDLKVPGGCLARLGTGLHASTGSPGFTEEMTAAWTWEISGRVCAPGKTVAIKVQAPITGGFTLTLWDLDGNPVRHLASGARGTHTFTLEGRGDQGQPLPRGAYVLGLSSPGHPLKKAVVAITGQ